MSQHVLVTGAAGFIGSYLCEKLLSEGATVLGIDNLSRGSRALLQNALEHPRFRFVELDLTDLSAYRAALKGQAPLQAVWHLAANSDIPAGGADPNVDLRDTFLTTFNTALLMREFGIGELAFASTSAVYGDHKVALREDTGPLFPISNYGAMKLASEAVISAAVESFLKRAWIFRFPNVIGPRATHGIIYDLLKKLALSPPDLEVLGDGSQQKPYLHVSELIDAMSFIVRHAPERLSYYNIGAEDSGVTVRYIAETVGRIAAPGLPIRYTGGSRGWVGDVPRFEYSVEKLAALGWRPQHGSAQAIDRAVAEIHREFQDKCSSSS